MTSSSKWRVIPDELVEELRAAGVYVSRNSRCQWIVSRSDPVVKEWLRDQAARFYRPSPEPEVPAQEAGVLSGNEYPPDRIEVPSLEPDPEVDAPMVRGGRHILPPPTPVRTPVRTVASGG